MNLMVNYEHVCDEFEYLRRFENESLINIIVRFWLNFLGFKVEDKPSNIELMKWFEYVCSLPCIPNPYETVASFDESSSNYISMIKNSNMEVHTNHDEIVSAMYDKFLHLVHTSYNINNHFDALPHVNQTLSQSVEKFDNKLQEDTNNKLEETTNMKICMKWN